MKHSPGSFGLRHITLIVLVVGLCSCDRSSSPEGRMSIQIETLQKQMMDSMRQQNRAILDSLGKIREELRELQERKQ